MDEKQLKRRVVSGSGGFFGTWWHRRLPNDCRFDPPYDQPKVIKKCVTHKSQLYHPGTPKSRGPWTGWPPENPAPPKRADVGR
uniref:Uncharacterized protein n=1 Tax=Hyaloperonospora arabidopsidis (strain Emoy2) TaxID=559515 RepID=M4BQI6_HYAAE